MHKNKRIINENISLEDISYVAGIIDSGSSFCITQQQRDRRPSRSWDTMIIISNGQRELLNHLNRLLFKGDSSISTLQNDRAPHDNPIYRLKIGGPMLDFLLPKITPKLVTKKKHAQLLSLFRETLRNENSYHKTVPQHIEELRDQIFEEMIVLNNSTSGKRNHSLIVKIPPPMEKYKTISEG